MLSSDIVIRRLALIKYLYGVGIEQSQKPEPLCSISILTFHDAIELFLQLAAEYLNISMQKKECAFMNYWKLLSPKIPKGGPTQQVAMERLNKARVGLKHYGILPSKFEIESFRVSATNFFEENTPLIFNVDFSTISLVDLIQYEETKNYLKEAMALLDKNNITKSLDKIAIAFSRLIFDYYQSIRKTKYSHLLRVFDKPATFTNSLNIKLDNHNRVKINEALSKFGNEVREALVNINDVIKILILGIDYRKYVKFRLLTPTVHRSGTGKYSVYRIIKLVGSNDDLSMEDVQFCIDFVIESAVILQESYTKLK